jgi:drug/metabolite transporter (DMT)-like permease
MVANDAPLSLHGDKHLVGPERKIDQATTARLLLVLLALAWGLGWPVMKIALDEIGVFTFRAFGLSIGALSLFTVIRLQGGSAAIARGVARRHIAIAAAMNVIGFALFSSLAVLAISTARVVMVNYSMPVWASLFAWLVLGERLRLATSIGLGLCIAGLAVLLVPFAQTKSATGLLLALGCALSWAGGTVYMKWARIPGDLLTITAWQIVIGAAFFGIGAVLLHGLAAPSAVSPPAMLAVLYNGLIGTGLAYLLWFAIIERLPTATAALGTLTTPVVGILSSMLILGERPTIADGIGFTLIFAAAACVLLQPRGQPPLRT